MGLRADGLSSPQRLKHKCAMLSGYFDVIAQRAIAQPAKSATVLACLGIILGGTLRDVFQSAVRQDVSIGVRTLTDAPPQYLTRIEESFGKGKIRHDPDLSAGMASVDVTEASPSSPAESED